MFKWFKLRRYKNISSAMKTIYRNKLLPLEKESLFNHLHFPPIEEKLFDAKPMILLCGQYSTGKTTFMKTLVGKDIPGIWIGPEPTTDRFMAVMSKDSPHRETLPGNTLVMNPQYPFHGLIKFGSGFLNRFQASLVDSPFLHGITVVDTPGVLSGEQQRLNRGYDFPQVLRWFADNADRIVLIFDAHKTDISDELRCCIEELKGHPDKVRIILNKADTVDHHHLIKIYGSLLWSLGKVIPTPEVPKVYIGSFWDQPIQQDVYKGLFEDEKSKLVEDLQSIPRNCCLRKMNDLIKRTHLLKAHALVMAHLYENSKGFFRRRGKYEKEINCLPETYKSIQTKYSINSEYFPNLQKIQSQLNDIDFSKLNKIRNSQIRELDKMLNEDIPILLTMVDEDEDRNSDYSRDL